MRTSKKSRTGMTPQTATQEAAIATATTAIPWRWVQHLARLLTLQQGDCQPRGHPLPPLAWVRPARRVFDEGQPLARRNSASSYLSQRQQKMAAHHAASRVESKSKSYSTTESYFSSTSLAKMLQPTTSSDGGGGSRRTRHKTGRSKGAPRSTSGSGLMNVNKHHVRYQSGGHMDMVPDGSSGGLGQRASSSSSLLRNGSFDSNYAHLYSYSSDLDLFDHQLYKSDSKRAARSARLANHQPSMLGREPMKDFDLMMETQLLMDRTNQLVGKRPSDKEWVI